jgi:hypothetical protein
MDGSDVKNVFRMDLFDYAQGGLPCMACVKGLPILMSCSIPRACHSVFEWDLAHPQGGPYCGSLMCAIKLGSGDDGTSPGLQLHSGKVVGSLCPPIRGVVLGQFDLLERLYAHVTQLQVKAHRYSRCRLGTLLFLCA